MKAPAFQFYAAEYLADEHVQLMTLEQEGAYIRLLSFCWREGSIPSEITALSSLTKGASTTVLTVVVKRFKPHADNAARLVHPRLEAERLKQQEWREKSARGGRKSGKVRKRKAKGSKQLQEEVKGGSTKQQPDASTKAEPPCLNTSSASSSSSASASSIATPEGKKRDKRTDKPSDPRSKLPAIVAVRSITGKFPHLDIYDAVIEAVGEHPDIALMKKCWLAWRTKDFKATNYGWVVDWYVNGIPGETNGKNRSGHESASERNARNLRENAAYIRGLSDDGGAADSQDSAGLLASRV